MTFRTRIFLSSLIVTAAALLTAAAVAAALLRGSPDSRPHALAIALVAGFAAAALTGWRASAMVSRRVRSLAVPPQAAAATVKALSIFESRFTDGMQTRINPRPI